MNDEEAKLFIVDYFEEIFTKRNISSLDSFLHKDYWDDDIGDPNVNHIENSKEYLANLFKENKDIDIDVDRVMSFENTIVAYLTWYENKNKEKMILRRGVVIFEVEKARIKKRHTYLYSK